MTDLGETVLIVDDSPEALGLLTDTLEAEGLTVLVATSGQGALDLLAKVEPHVILMDGVMPGLDGFQTTRAIKQTPGRDHIPVIFMTGLTDTHHVVAGLAAGGVDYVTKPIKLEEMIARIRVHMANARRSEGARAALDATGRSLLSLSEDGRLLWSTPRAEEMLAGLLPGGRLVLDDLLAAQLLSARGSAGGAVRVALEGGQVEFTYLNPVRPGEYLFRVTEEVPGAREALLRERFTLTQREAEVLVWLAAGKSNLDISEILGNSAATVKKHLLQIYAKLGAENRATAAAMAVQVLAERG
ncbi:response regulator [Pseudooceanicola sp. CBS1P-1]|uniref:Response regulator n=1 Tax=Pseudooceanicola albus TaxID=2692189 RepID=A0A6L7FYW5_9RHOB|nr:MULTISPECIES: DNA-binding response regulator [Pseudooceanicola]MBT9382430.1 response regulator [Pseudooceanicola endophyticus]MXN16971.1 response regulator [Pseudooceanicola albus]